MEPQRFVAAVESGPVLRKIRQGTFAKSEFERALFRTAAIPSLTDQVPPPRLVSVLWHVPLFMSCQVEGIREAGGNTEWHEQNA
jgi:hypothetical protein